MRELLCAWLPKALQALGFVPGKSCIHTGMSQNPFPKQFSLCHIHREREFSPKSKGSLEPDTLNLLKRKQQKIFNHYIFFHGNCAVMETPEGCNPSQCGIP